MGIGLTTKFINRVATANTLFGRKEGFGDTISQAQAEAKKTKNEDASNAGLDILYRQHQAQQVQQRAARGSIEAFWQDKIATPFAQWREAERQRKIDKEMAYEAEVNARHEEVAGHPEAF
jgi:hypothetical protein